MTIERARPEDAPAVETLLASAGLPLDGAREALATGVVARADGADGAGGAIVAAASVERYGASGLLRSVVVAADRRGTGLGRQIVTAAEDLARETGIVDLYLLTETAVDWFPRLGYEVVPRAEAAAAVGASVEFTTLCRDSGVPMRRRIASD
jgi:amino-acid N-acetyltransferase